ncbi:hypothetical protein OIDMADRAFT_208481 [Oidiodendron maius Zn]|uniref:Uncharacterized protein n=1 Tax=Oidiodendron maius (strain Zn) TaxID=913774 RepID=A0A0C3GR12_OIDMZ|nr:hypothetical protein OIDMADRAFT_208481 [Oidiodendron maius Zn]
MSNPLLLPEIVGLVVDNVHMVPDLLSCACVNSTWSVAALKRLYNGSLNDMQFRTPDIGSLNCLFVASRERFTRNMGFVKHLLLSPESPAIDEVALPNTSRLICIEKCRAMRHRQSAELLLQPQGEGLASFTIPFEIEGQDWSLISDLLLTRTVEFLAIDDFYCGLLMAGSNYSQGLATPAVKFSNLKALTIYKSGSGQDIDKLCRLLKCCDLQFFHLEEPSGSGSLTQSDTMKLLSCLRQQENLVALALIIPRCIPLVGSASTTLTCEEQGGPWPMLMALYLGVWDQHWLEQLPKFEKLQILSLQKFTPNTPSINQDAIEKIAKCQYLRVIDIVFQELEDVESLLDITRSCPLLQKFSVKLSGFRGEPERAEALCIGLLRALPRLEHFELDLRFRMDGARLQDLARRCPRLTVLALPRTRLCLSLALLTKAHRFWQLETMHFAEIFFEDPRRLMQWDKIRGLAEEWRRIFPKLRGMPCPADVYSRYMQEDDLTEEWERDGPSGSAEGEMSDFGEESEGDMVSVSTDEEMSLSEPGLDFDENESDWFILRTKLWKILGYQKHLLIRDSIQNMWQTNLEIETIGWPVVPLMAFSDPDAHSTTAKSHCGYLYDPVYISREL